MKFINSASLVICIVAGQALSAAVGGTDSQELVARQMKPIKFTDVSFNVAPAGKACGSGTTISCSASVTQSCKGNFNPAQASFVITKPAAGCHVSLYGGFDQTGGAIVRIDTNDGGNCIAAPPPLSVAFKSYGVFCP